MTDRAVRLLLVEDNPADVVLLEEHLAERATEQFEIRQANCLADALEQLAGASFDAILLDLSLPDSLGLETVERTAAAAPNLPVIVLTGQDDEAIGTEAVRLGAQDYLTKQKTSPEILVRSIRYAIERKRLITQLRCARDELDQRVKERTAELAQTVAKLEGEVQERQRAQEALRESEERYRTLVELFPDAVNVIAEGKFVYVNPAGVRLFGAVCLEELAGKPVLDFIPANYRPMSQARIEQLAGLGLAPQEELKIVRVDGQVLDVESMGKQITYDGRPAILGVVRDITERKAAEQRAQVIKSLLELFATKTSRKEYLDAVVEVIRRWSGCRCVGLRVVEAQANIPFAASVGLSRAFLKLENRLSLRTDNCACIRVIAAKPAPPDSATMTPFGSFRCDNAIQFVNHLTPLEQAQYRGNCIKAGFASLAVIPIRYRQEILGAIHLADEQEGKVPCSTVEFLESVGPLIGEAIFRFRVEEELRGNYQKLQETEARYRQLFEAACVGIGVSDCKGRIIDVNPAMAQFHGMSREELKQCRLADLFAEPSQGRHLLRSLRRQDRLIDWEATLHRKDAAPFVALIDTHSLKLGNQDLNLILVRDITFRRQLESEVVRIGELERQRIGQELHDSLGQELTGMACFTEVLRKKLAAKGLPEVNQAAEIAKILKNSVRLCRSLARNLCPVEMTAEGLMMSLGELVRQIDLQFGIPCRFKCDDSALVHDSAIAGQLYRIAQEALNNAAKHSHATQIQVNFITTAEGVMLVIRDNGVGLPEKLNPNQGMGMATMSYRARMIGATFHISRTAIGGTEVVCTLKSAGPAQPIQPGASQEKWGQ